MDGTQVEGERGPAILALRREPVVELDLGRPRVRFAPRPGAQFDERIRLFRPGGEQAARAVILERPAEQPHAGGEQGGGEGVAGEAPVCPPVERERELAPAVDPSAPR